MKKDPNIIDNTDTDGMTDEAPETFELQDSPDKKKRFAIYTAAEVLIIIVAVTLAVIFIRSVWFSAPKHVSEYISESFYIIHAGGQMKGGDGKSYTYTNSLDSLKNMYRKGNRVVELDFAFTTDDQVVCLHKWADTCYTNENDKANASLEGHPLSYDEFMSVKIDGFFNPMSLDDVLSFMKKHKNLVLITDIKETFDENGGSNNELTRLCSRIMEKAPGLKDRIVIQIYRQEQYDQVRALGFDNMIYTLYTLSEDEKLDTTAHREFAKTHPLIAFTLEKKLLKKKKFIKKMKKTGVPLLVHTVDKKKKIEKLAANETVSGIYTNIVDNH